MARYITLSYNGLWLVNVTGTLSSDRHVEFRTLSSITLSYNGLWLVNVTGTLSCSP